MKPDTLNLPVVRRQIARKVSVINHNNSPMMRSCRTKSPAANENATAVKLPMLLVRGVCFDKFFYKHC